MMGVDDKRALPECANAMMCCDDKQLAVDAFVAMTDEEAVAPPLLMDLIYICYKAKSFTNRLSMVGEIARRY